MSLPFTGQQCFFIAMLVFIVLGFQRGWRRELVSLVFVLLASVLINPGTSDNVSGFLGRVPAIFAYMTNSAPPQTNTSAVSFLSGPVWSLIIFIAVVVLGYVVGNKAFPRPTAPQDRFLGVILGVVSGAFILAYLSNYMPSVTVDLADSSPSNYIPVIFVIAILALIVALIAARVKKAPVKK